MMREHPAKGIGRQVRRRSFSASDAEPSYITETITSATLLWDQHL